jgi:hypothetical protein
MRTTRSALERLADQNPEVTTHRATSIAENQALAGIFGQPRDTNDPPRHSRTPVMIAAAVTVMITIASTAGIAVVRGGGDYGSNLPAQSAFVLPDASAPPFELAPSDGAAGMPSALVFVAFDRPVTSSDLFGSLAASAASQPPARGEGRFEYFHTREWGFYTLQTQDGEVFDRGIAESTREDWRAPDGSGRFVTTQDGDIDTVEVPPQPAAPGIAIARANSVDETRRVLREGKEQWTGAQWFEAYTATWSARILSPQEQAAYLQELGEQPDVEVVGEVADRAGRNGVAVSTSSADIRTVLIFDPDTGALLDFERIALSTAAVEVPVPIPSTVGYTVYLDRGYTPTEGERP